MHGELDELTGAVQKLDPNSPRKRGCAMTHKALFIGGELNGQIHEVRDGVETFHTIMGTYHCRRLQEREVFAAEGMTEPEILEALNPTQEVEVV
jgi:hypothetical protein